MSENATNNKNVRDDEIDLLDLFRRIAKTMNKLFSSLGRAFMVSIVFLIRKWIPLSISIITGIALSYILRVTSDSFYTSDIVLRNNLVSNSDMIAYLNRLHTFSFEKNEHALAEAISVNAQQVNNILDISAFWIIDQTKDGIPDYVDYSDSHNVYDTVNVRMQDRLDVRVKIKAPQELSLVRNGIIKFIERDSLFQQRNRVRVRQNLELLTRLNYDIEQLDSLQKIKYFQEAKIKQPQNGGQMIFLQEQKTQLIFPEIQTLYTKKQSLEAERDLYKGVVTILSDFSLPAVRDNGSLYYAIRLIPLLFFTMLLALIILSNRKKLKEVFNKY